ncbi:MAG: winged helix-turn-helix domain-containing protein, partial [Pseudolabrys sp.]
SADATAEELLGVIKGYNDDKSVHGILCQLPLPKHIPETTILRSILPEKDVDWYLADEYYRKLKETGRVRMLDTGLETDDVGKVLAEARRLGAEVALLLTAKGAKDGTLLRERLFWVSDGSKFVDAETTVDTEYSKNLKFGQEYFVPQTGEPVMSFNLPFKAGLVTVGDVTLDERQMKVSVRGVPIALSPLEYRVVAYLLLRRGRVVSQAELDENVYGHGEDHGSNALEVLIGRVRRKLGVDLIETRRGFGYLVPDGLS